MFMKFLVTVAVIALIWFGFKYLQRMSEMRDRREDGARDRAVPRSRQPEDEAMDLVQCRVCGTWQPGRTAKSCGRKDCPY